MNTSGIDETGVEPEGSAAIDYGKLEKPAHMSEEVWRQHLDWLEVMGEQLDENISKREEAEADKTASSDDDSKPH